MTNPMEENHERREKHWRRVVLAVFLLIFLSLAAAWPVLFAQDEVAPDYESVMQQFSEAEKKGEYDKAIDILKQMEDSTFTRHIEVVYNMARMYSFSGDISKAYEYLYWATDSGFWDLKRMMEDEAFENISQEKLFKELARKAWSNGYIWMLEREQREEFQKKDEIIETLDLTPGMYVADVGAGSGYFAIPIARIIGPQGTLLATDIRQEMLDHMARRIKIEKLDNIELLLAKADDPLLPKGKVDLILMVDVYHYIQERTAFGEKLLEGLAPDGRLVVIDYIPKPWEERPWGPPPSQHLSEETLSSELGKAGFKVIRKYDFLPEQFFVIYGAK